MKQRIKYGVIIIIIIIAGLLSRRIHGMPLWIGDTLYAAMMYFMLRLVLLRKTVLFIAVISLLICFAIEFSQLWQAPWLNQLRSTLPGKLILGQGFLWEDLLAYTLGAALGALMDKYFCGRLRK